MEMYDFLPVVNIASTGYVQEFSQYLQRADTNATYFSTPCIHWADTCLICITNEEQEEGNAPDL
jgi:hypothetical protein